jgi:hypothetical protein
VGVVSPSFVFYSVFEGYFYLRVFKESCYFPCFFSTVCESGPFLFPVFWVGVCIFPLWGWMFFFSLTLKTLLCECKTDEAVSETERNTCALSYVTADNSRPMAYLILKFTSK